MHSPERRSPQHRQATEGNKKRQQSQYTKTGGAVSHCQIIDAFQAAMAAGGIVTDAPILGDSQLHRIHIEGQRRGTRNGAYILHSDDHPAGWFQDFVTGVSGTWRMDGGTWRVDEATRRLIEAEKAKRKAEQAERHGKKAIEAYQLWSQAAPADDGHPYLIKKSVKAHPGVKVGTWRKWHQDDSGQWRQITIENCLLVPLIAPDGKLANVQAIFPENHPDLGRDKDFMGGRKAGCFFVIGAQSDTILVAEGYATGSTLHEHTGHQAIVAFDCGNIKAVALAVRQNYPQAKLIVCADNDRHTPGNPGVTKGREAALAVGGLLSIPSFPPGVPGTDWNDFYAIKDGSLVPPKTEIQHLAVGAISGEAPL